MPTTRKIYELKNESLQNVLSYIEKETRRQKNRHKKDDDFAKTLARKAREEILHYDRSAKEVFLKKKFFQIYPLKIGLKFSFKKEWAYFVRQIKLFVNTQLDKLDKNRVFKVFFREMAILLKSGISIIPALDISREHATSKRFKNVLARVIYDLKANGSSLTSALERYPNYFSKLYLCIINSGERTCNLPLVFEELAQVEERSSYLKNKLKGALIYPLFIGSFSLVVLYVLTRVLVPAIVSLGANIEGVNIRGAAKAVIYIARVFSYPVTSFIILTVLLSAVFLFYLFLKTPEGRYKWDKFTLRVPVIGNALLKVSVIQFCIILHILHKSGISILSATKILSDVFENSYIKSKLEEIVFPRVNFGYQLSSGLKELGFFPPIALQFIATGEESGRFSELLKKTIEVYKFEVEDSLVRLSNVLEPVIIVAFGALICCIAMVAMLPIYQIVSAF